jgi:sugar fermentation stimulation protein A
MRIEGKIVKGIFIERPNRFLGKVEVERKEHFCYIPNPGRMVELLQPGVEIFLKEEPSSERKTEYDLVFVKQSSLISIDSRVPNRLTEEAIRLSLLPEFRGYDLVRAEYTHGDSRFDFLLSHGGRRMLLEVKSCTLVRGGRALFPDAPTQRGRRHLHTLIAALKQGFEAAVLFVIQRADAEIFSSNDETDPEFGAALREADSRGVKIYAYNCQVTLEEIGLLSRVAIAM